MGKNYKPSAPRTVLQETVSQADLSDSQTVQQQDHIDYGVVTEVNNKTSQVKVKLFDDDVTIKGGAFLPIMNPLSQIHLQWGLLRKGMVCRVHWRGKQEPQNFVMVEIIGDEAADFLERSPKENEMSVGPFKIFSGGMGIL